MNSLNFVQDDLDPEVWIDWEYRASHHYPDIMVQVTTTGTAPSEEYKDQIIGVLKDTTQLVMDAARLILSNYSYEHFKRIGIDANILVEETIEAIVAVLELEAVFFEEPDESSFEMSFSVPWDEEHAYDVEFCNAKATFCSING